VRAKEARPAPDLVQRNFAAAGCDRLWVADITYLEALNMALEQRRPEGVMHHSD